MTTRVWSRSYQSYGEFYSEAYGEQIAELRTAGTFGVTFLEAHQPAGDWSDAPTPDLAYNWAADRPVPFSADLSAGRFNGSMQPGEALLQAPGAATSIQVHGRHVVRGVGIPYASVLKRVENDELPPTGDFGRLHAGAVRDAVLAALVKTLWREVGEGSPHGALFVDGAVLQILARLTWLSGTSVKRAFRGGLTRRQLRAVEDYISANLDRQIGLGELSALLDLSAWHFCRAFKVSVGQTPAAWMTERRVEKAKERMRGDPFAPVTEIAFEVGFGSSSAFSTAFRRVVGRPPRSWRRDVLFASKTGEVEAREEQD